MYLSQYFKTQKNLRTAIKNLKKSKNKVFKMRNDLAEIDYETKIKYYEMLIADNILEIRQNRSDLIKHYKNKFKKIGD